MSCPPQLLPDQSDPAELQSGENPSQQHKLKPVTCRTPSPSCRAVCRSPSLLCKTPSPACKTPSLTEKLNSVDLVEVARKLSSQVTTPLSSPLHGSKKHGDEDPEDDEDEGDDEEGGAHDTITSLAGAQMLQKFSKIGTRDRKFRSAGLNDKDLKGSITQLESLFKEDPLLEEDEKVAEEECEAEPEQEDDVFVPPDGGYGWFVSLGAFIALFWTAGMVKSYGVLFAEMITLYPDNISLAAWIPAVMTTTALAMAPVASALCQRFNCRAVTLLGSLLASAGVALTSLMPGLHAMFLTLGLLTGAGLGLATTPGIILTARYFDRRRSLANALCLSGTAAGSFTLPVLISRLLDQYGFRGTLLLLGGCLLHVCISAALFRPLATHVIIVRNQERESKVVRSESSRTDTTAAPAREPATAAPAREPATAALAQGPLPGPPSGSAETESDLVFAPGSLPAYPAGSPRSRRNTEEFSLSRQSPLHSSLDSISMMSSASQEQLAGAGCPHQSAYWSGRTSPATSNAHFSISSSHCRLPNVTSAKSLSLRELALHQIGSHLSLYRNMLVGSGKSDIMDMCDHDKVLLEKKTKKKSSLMFSCEDIMVDSTSVLKDSRHPSHTHLSRGGETHRVVNLNRTQSAVGDIRRRKTSARTRFYSETFDKEGKRLSRNSSFCQRGLGRTGLIGSTELFAVERVEQDRQPPTRKFVLHPVQPAEQARAVGGLQRKGRALFSLVEKYLDVSLVRDPVFLLLAGSVMMMAVGVPHCLFFLPSHAKHIGLPPSDASFLLSISAIFDLAGRLALGFSLDLNLFPKHLAYSLMMMVAGIAGEINQTMSSNNRPTTCMRDSQLS